MQNCVYHHMLLVLNTNWRIVKLILKSHPIIYQLIDFIQFYKQDLEIIAVTFLPICSEFSCLLVLTVDVRKRVMMQSIIFSDAETTLMKE